MTTLTTIDSLPAARSWLATGLATVLAMLAAAAPVQAGCGCEKPPPKPAQVRPAVTYGGMPVTLFGANLAADSSYDVTFTAMNGATATVRGTVAVRRDLADGVVKPQLEVSLPASLPLGPARIAVKAVGAATTLLAISDDAFTVAPQPIALPTAYGAWTYPGSRAAVGRDGVTYVTLDLTTMTAPFVFEAELAGYPLRFTAKDLVFTNTQGFLMQLLVQPTSGEAIPGMFVYPSTSATTSDTLHYSRHEFSTYYLQHLERQPHAVDPTDANWHIDGTRHIDHDHLVVAIIGRLKDGSLPLPGATPAFDLKVRAHSLFYQGLVGTGSLVTSRSARIDSFVPAPSLLESSPTLEASLTAGTLDSATLDAATADAMTTDGTTSSLDGATTDSTLTTSSKLSGSTFIEWDSYSATSPRYGSGGYTYGRAGDIFTNGNLALGDGATVYGSAAATSFNLGIGAAITGTQTPLSSTQTFMPVQVPSGVPNLGALTVTTSRTLIGPGSFQLSNLSIGKKAVLYVNNTAGPVTLYVTGAFTTATDAVIRTTDPNPEKLAIYVTSTGRVSLGNSSSFYGVIYAPTSSVGLSGSGEFFGAFVGSSVSLGASSRVHYDETLRGH